MGNKFSVNVDLNVIEREWMAISYPTLLNAIQSQNRNQIKNELIKLKKEFPKSGIHDLMSAIDVLRTLRDQQIKFNEIESETNFSGILKKRSTVVKCYLNNKQIYAVFDSGADNSFIGLDRAKLHGILHLTDLSDKWTKRAIGLGVKTFVGRIHSNHIRFDANKSFEIRFPLMVINYFELPFLVFGLDFMNWFQCSIDFRSSTIYLTKIDESFKFICDQCLVCLSKTST